MKFITPILGAAFFAAFTAVASAGTVNLSGNTTTAPTFNRPTETGARSFFSAHYNVYRVTLNTSGAFTFALNAVDPSSYDTFAHLFVDAFNPADTSDPAANFVAGNDDGSVASSNSQLSNVTLNSTRTYFFVTDGFGTADAGAYTASITGPGTIQATSVPEPSSAALAIVAGAVLLFRLRSRRLLLRQS